MIISERERERENLKDADESIANVTERPFSSLPACKTSACRWLITNKLLVTSCYQSLSRTILAKNHSAQSSSIEREVNHYGRIPNRILFKIDSGLNERGNK